jgi:predicted MFS family arabinose efflux permease
MVCVGMLAGALFFGYIIEREKLCMLFSLGGILLAFAGIILVLCSKPKKQKPEKPEALSESDITLNTVDPERSDP